jgi:TonB family protein
MALSPSASPATRFAAALAASAALHAGAAYVASAAPRGSPHGTGPLLAQPLHARILGADAPALEPRVHPPPVLGAALPDVSGERSAIESAGPPAILRPLATRPAPPAAAQSFGVHEGPRYFLPSQLDVRPRLLTRVEPMYPQGAPPEGGYVVLRLLIGEDGDVERAIVVVSDPVDQFGEAAAAAFRTVQFSSGKLNGIAVKSQLMIEMTFDALLPPGVASAAGAKE